VPLPHSPEACGQEPDLSEEEEEDEEGSDDNELDEEEDDSEWLNSLAVNKYAESGCFK
jgi:hypothetical protein